ncbi:MAG: nucleotidyltransferase family protein [Oscillospiraceae bacterium]
MNIAGIIAEYNPFHRGHALQIELLRQAGYDAVVCVISPGVVQRGSLAVFPSEVRAKAAIEGGADLVLSLPAPFALCSAEGFAAAGVQILSALGNVNTLNFGMEASDVKDIVATATLLLSDEYKTELKASLANGASYASAAAAAAGKLLPSAEDILREPNNILAVEYCKAIIRQKSKLVPTGLTRVTAQHDEKLSNKDIASASAVRLLLKKDAESARQYVPINCMPIYEQAIKDGLIIDNKSFSVAVLSRLRAMSKEQIFSVRNINEGLEHRLYTAIQSAGDIDSLYSALKCKRYAHARMRRLVLDAALGYTKALDINVPYIHILAANKRGLEVLSSAKSTLAISQSLAKLSATSSDAKAVAIAHCAAEDLAALCMRSPQPMGQSFTTKMYKK